MNPSHQMSSISFILKCTRNCNLRCRYCKDWRNKNSNNIDIPQLASFFKDLSSINTLKEINFIWHGGEPLLQGLSYFRKVYFLQNQIFKTTAIRNILQTNGTLVDEDWANHFAEYNFSIGVSLDGFEETHNKNRIYSNLKGSFSDSLSGIKLLKKQNIQFGVLTVISEDLLRIGPEKLIDFYLENNIYKYAFLSLRKKWKNSADALLYNFNYGQFISKALNYWLSKDNLDISIRELDSKMDLVFNIPGRVCKDSGPCVGKYFGFEPSGDIYHCDKFINDDRFFFGNVKQNTISAILSSKKLQEAQQIENDIRSKCKLCKWYNMCKGGCLSDLIELEMMGGKRGTADCQNYSIYEHLSEYLINYFLTSELKFK